MHTSPLGLGRLVNDVQKCKIGRWIRSQRGSKGRQGVRYWQGGWVCRARRRKLECSWVCRNEGKGSQDAVPLRAAATYAFSFWHRCHHRLHDAPVANDEEAPENPNLLKGRLVAAESVSRAPLFTRCSPPRRQCCSAAPRPCVERAARYEPTASSCVKDTNGGIVMSI